MIHKANLGKALIALANNGGGFFIFGYTETPQGLAVAPNRPDNLAAYTPDTVNAVVSAYAEPSFHCDVNIVTGQNGLDIRSSLYPEGIACLLGQSEMVPTGKLWGKTPIIFAVLVPRVKFHKMVGNGMNLSGVVYPMRAANCSISCATSSKAAQSLNRRKMT